MATVVAWRDLTLSTDTGHKIEKVEGWESRPPTRYDKQQRARGHGAHPSPVYADERIVTVTGSAHSADDRDQLVADLQDGMWLAEEEQDEEPLTITLAGRTLTAGAQLLSCDPVVATGSYNVGLLRWVARWRCPDPLRYGPETASDVTGLPTPGTGLAWPLFADGTLDWGQLGDPGQIVLDNPGTAPAPIAFAVTGPLPGGFEISSGGQRLTYPTPVPAGQVISIDTDTGIVLAEGTADRRGELTYADWLTIPRRSALTVQFTALSTDYSPAAQLDGTWRPAYW